MNVLQSMMQYVKNGHTVEIEHVYNFRNVEGATEEKKIPSYQLEPLGLMYMKRMAVKKNLEKTDCVLTMNIYIKFS